MPTYNYAKLRGRIIEIFGSQRAFAVALGKSDEYVSRILNNKAYLEQPDMDVWIELLQIADDDLHSYFFTRLVDETQTI